MIIKYEIHEIHLWNCLHCHPNFENRGWTECSLRFRPLSLETQRGRGTTVGARIQLRTYPMHLTPRKAGHESAQKPPVGRKRALSSWKPAGICATRCDASSSSYVRICHAQRLVSALCIRINDASFIPR